MTIIEKLDEFGKPAWIALTILGFFIWWPIGLATLAFAIGSRRMMCGHRSWQHKMDRMQQKMNSMRDRMGGSSWGMGSSGNRAFDEYRTETLHRLEQEQKEFHEFLGRLRMAKDKAEFDQFMADRNRRPAENPPSEGPQNEAPQTA
jgi:Protein of unknown function (DUF2852)